MRPTTTHFDIASGNREYTVTATQYLNGIEERRYRVCINENPVCVFGWNEDLQTYRLIYDVRNPQIPQELESVIGRRLFHCDIASVGKAA